MIIAENGNDVCIEESVNHNQHWRFELRSDGRYDIVSVVNLKYIGSWGDIGVVPFLKTITLGWDIQAVNAVAEPIPIISNYTSGVAFDVDHNFVDVSVGKTFATQPVIFADMQTINGADPAGLRIKDVSTSQFTVKVEEEQSGGDLVISHAPEKIGFLAFETGILQDASGHAIGEVGSIQVNQTQNANWRTLNFNRTYENPVVIMTMNTYNGPAPSHMRIQSVSNDSVSYRIEEWDYLTDNNTHAEETVAYMVVEEGNYILSDGTSLNASKFTHINNESSTISLPFWDIPVVISQSQTTNGEQAIVTRDKHIDDGYYISFIFELSLQEEKNNDQVHADETVGVIAIGQGY